MPIQRSPLAGDAETGVTIMQMDVGWIPATCCINLAPDYRRRYQWLTVAISWSNPGPQGHHTKNGYPADLAQATPEAQNEALVTMRKAQ